MSKIGKQYTIQGSKMGTVKRKKMKLTLKQRLRNWLMNSDNEIELDSIPQPETAHIQSNGMRFQLFKASGGYVIETTHYDDRRDERINKMYVVTEEQDIGKEIGKIITMEALRT